MSSRDTGRAGEDFAAERLKEEGYTVLERNWRSGHQEIDIIAKKEDVIAFVEVKVRRAGGLVTPAEAVTMGQMRRIVCAAAAYLIKEGIYNTGKVQPRFDVCLLTSAGSGSARILDYRHLEHAYDLEGFGVSL